MKNLRLNELENINGGKITKYPNGLYCNSETGTCSVDWGEAVSSIANNLVNSIGTGMGGVANPWAYVGNHYGNYRP